MKSRRLRRINERAVDRGLPIETRLSLRMIIVGAVSSAAGMVVCILAKTHPMAIVSTALMAFFVPILYVMCLIRTRIKTMQYTMLVGVVLIFPFLWLYGGGVNSGMSIWIVFEILFFTVSLSGLVQKVALVMAGLLFMTVLTLEKTGILYYKLPSSKHEMISTVGSTIVVGFMVFYMSDFQKKLYKGEFSLAEEKNVQLEKYAKEAERANAYQKIFLANMSHEIRSPLNVVLGFNRLIMDSNDLDEIHSFAKNIDNSGESLLVIINDILDYSKIEAGKMEIFPSVYDFREMVQLCYSSIKVQCEEKGLEFSMVVDQSIPHKLYGDSVRLRQCTTNLLTNAFKYTDKGFVKLEFKNGGVDWKSQTAKLIISVSDSGRGMTKKQMGELFTRFQRLDEDTNRSIEGTGLGLALTKSFLELMGGEISVSSKQGEGSVFTITIEQKLAEDIDSDGLIESETSEEIDVKNMQVCVVDDSATNLVLMKRILQKFEVETDTAPGGMELLEMIKTKKYDLIFMDHMMPGIDGVETYKCMQVEEHINKETPVVMLTANAMSGAMEEYLKLGFDGYLSKPCKPDDIKKTLEQYAKR